MLSIQICFILSLLHFLTQPSLFIRSRLSIDNSLYFPHFSNSITILHYLSHSLLLHLYYLSLSLQYKQTKHCPISFIFSLLDYFTPLSLSSSEAGQALTSLFHSLPPSLFLHLLHSLQQKQIKHYPNSFILCLTYSLSHSLFIRSRPSIAPFPLSPSLLHPTLSLSLFNRNKLNTVPLVSVRLNLPISPSI